MRGVALSKNSNRLLTCGQDRNILLYRLDRLGAAEEFEGPEVGSRHAIFGPTEREIYVASEDGSLNFTDLRTGNYVYQFCLLYRHDFYCTKLVFWMSSESNF